tara:strand:- start:320 stop:679 length:360 start_codon:yes stop_codon:yes gene_type:complete
MKETETNTKLTLDEILNSDLMNSFIKEQDETLAENGWTYEEIKSIAKIVTKIGMIKENYIKATENYSKSTFTIRKYVKGVLVQKYRTIPMTGIEFIEAQNNTDNDWAYFLQTSNDYYAI